MGIEDIKSLIEEGNKTIVAVKTKTDDLESRLANIETKTNRPGGFVSRADDRTPFKTEAKKLANFLETGEGLERKDILATGTGAQGGFALPELISRTIQDQILNVSPIRQIAQVQEIASNDYAQLVGLRGATTTWNAETTTRAVTAEPTMSEVKPAMGELWAYPAVSTWALADLVINAEQWLQVNVSDAFAQAEGAAFVSGDGVNKPSGFLAGPTPVVTGDASRAFGTLQFLPSGAAGAFVAATASVSPADALVNMIYTLRAGYRANARWVMNSQTAGVVRKFKDLEGRFLWSDALAAGQPPLLLGFPVTIAEDMPDIGANTFPIAFGDFSRGYLVADRAGLRIIRDEITKPGAVRYLISKRVGGRLLDSNAIKLLKMSVS
jgi:HK97 family phage major capsid protein